MSCRKIRRSLSRYYKGELTTKEKELIDRHIQTCEECARETQGYKALNDAVSGLERFTPSSAFESKLQLKIREVPSAEKDSKAKSLFTVFPSLRWAFVPAAAVALALFLILKGGFHKSQTISEKPKIISSAETSLVGTQTMSQKGTCEGTQETPSQLVESSTEKSNFKKVPASYVREKNLNRKAVFVMDNLRLSDLEELPDTRVTERGSAYFVIDAVNYRPVDNRQTNVGYILPAVSTASSKVRKVY
ncbi:MAG TPA: zf-HC2 domain-containing protein [Terriglobales bacterium]|nr:zf-HC2 domain-containing protein [Terriglobales bacterium]